MLVVGLTGSIGSGKTLVSELFAELGIPVYNADNRARELMNAPEIKTEVIRIFGENAYVKGELNRSYLASVVFNNPEKLKKLNSIVHPAVKKDHLNWFKKQKAPYTIREAAILFESSSHKDCDKIITVSAPEEIRIKRVMKRDQMTRAEVLSRIKNQWSDDKKISLSDFIILNDGKNMLLPQVLEIHEELIKLSS